MYVRANRCTAVLKYDMTSCNFNEQGQGPYWHDWWNLRELSIMQSHSWSMLVMCAWTKLN